jgi:ATP-dependent Clp protease ATP-binding subunit ClpA
VSKLVLLDPTKTGRQAENLENQLHHFVVGQDEAIHQIVSAYQTHVPGLSPAGRPIGNFLFLGPTGSGKTRIVEATVESLLKDPRAVIKIDCAEFQHSHEIAKLIGSPPGFINRLDKIIIFKSLSVEELRKIIDIELELVQQRIQAAAVGKPFVVNVTDSAREFLLLEGTDIRYGARHLKRAIERLLVQPLSNLMASGRINRGDCIRVSHEDGWADFLSGREPEAVRAWGLASRAA